MTFYRCLENKALRLAEIVRNRSIGHIDGCLQRVRVVNFIGSPMTFSFPLVSSGCLILFLQCYVRSIPLKNYLLLNKEVGHTHMGLCVYIYTHPHTYGTHTLCVYIHTHNTYMLYRIVYQSYIMYIFVGSICIMYKLHRSSMHFIYTGMRVYTHMIYLLHLCV